MKQNIYIPIATGMSLPPPDRVFTIFLFKRKRFPISYCIISVFSSNDSILNLKQLLCSVCQVLCSTSEEIQYIDKFLFDQIVRFSLCMCVYKNNVAQLYTDLAIPSRSEPFRVGIICHIRRNRANPTDQFDLFLFFSLSVHHKYVTLQA